MARKTTRLVVKIGTSSITGGTPALQRPKMLEFVQQIARLHMHGTEVIVVSSGAIALGRHLLGLDQVDVPALVMELFLRERDAHLLRAYRDVVVIEHEHGFLPPSRKGGAS